MHNLLDQLKAAPAPAELDATTEILREWLALFGHTARTLPQQALVASTQKIVAAKLLIAAGKCDTPERVDATTQRMIEACVLLNHTHRTDAEIEQAQDMGRPARWDMDAEHDNSL